MEKIDRSFKMLVRGRLMLMLSICKTRSFSKGGVFRHSEVIEKNVDVIAKGSKYNLQTNRGRIERL